MKLYDIIEWNDPSALSNDLIVHKHEAEDFNTGSLLIVHENQTAVFYANGKALDKYPAGRHKLTTSNVPILSKLRNMLTDGETPYHCEVYYVNHIRETDVDWGFADTQTASIKFRGRDYTIQFTACGTFGFHVDFGEDGTNVGKFLSYLVGTRAGFTKEDVYDVIIGEFLQEVKTRLIDEMAEKEVSQVINIGRHYKEIAENITKCMLPVFEARYGITLDYVAFEKIKLSTESYNKIVEVQNKAVDADIAAEEAMVAAQAEAFKGRSEAEVEAYRRQVGGYTYEQESQREILTAAAKNEGGAGAFMNAGMGLGMGVGLGGAFGAGMAGAAQGMMGGVGAGMMGGMQQQPVQQAPAGVTCPDCGAQLPAGAKFCGSCGKKLGASCPSCGADLMPGAKFCASCGARLSTNCPGCGAELAPGAKFCGQCGTKI